MLLLNLGCGTRTHKDWINIDFLPMAGLRRLPVLRKKLPPNFMNHDLRRGIPFPDGSADAVYSSHLVEHLPPDSLPRFLAEHRRVLKPGGIVRIVVPDLELAARQYLEALEHCRVVGEAGRLEHEWAIILLLDQMVRVRSGGQMQAWLRRHKDTPFVGAMQGIFKGIANTPNPDRYGFSLKGIISWLQGKDYRMSTGELHRWMYDGLSLRRLLLANGFESVQRIDTDTSRISGWADYYLDRSVDGTIHQPGSIYIEGVKV